MRYFIFTTEGKGTRKDPHYVNVWEITNPAKMVRVGYRNFSYGSTRGVESEAYALLYENKIISDEDYEQSKGYYSCSNANIKITQV